MSAVCPLGAEFCPLPTHVPICIGEGESPREPQAQHRTRGSESLFLRSNSAQMATSA